MSAGGGVGGVCVYRLCACAYCIPCAIMCEEDDTERKLLRRHGWCLSLACGEHGAAVLGPLPARHSPLEPLAIKDHPRAAWPREAEYEEEKQQARESPHHLAGIHSRLQEIG